MKRRPTHNAKVAGNQLQEFFRSLVEGHTFNFDSGQRYLHWTAEYLAQRGLFSPPLSQHQTLKGFLYVCWPWENQTNVLSKEVIGPQSECWLHFLSFSQKIFECLPYARNCEYNSEEKRYFFYFKEKGTILKFILSRVPSLKEKWFSGA